MGKQTTKTTKTTNTIVKKSPNCETGKTTTNNLKFSTDIKNLTDLQIANLLDNKNHKNKCQIEQITYLTDVEMTVARNTKTFKNDIKLVARNCCSVRKAEKLILYFLKSLVLEDCGNFVTKFKLTSLGMHKFQKSISYDVMSMLSKTFDVAIDVVVVSANNFVVI